MAWDKEHKLFTYETKCRRCGKIEEWVLCHDYDDFSDNAIFSAMVDKTNSPRQISCDKCKKTTVQDVVAY